MNYIKISEMDIANGLGVGVVLWVSGCTQHCKGCHNPGTWDFKNGIPFTHETLYELLDKLDKPYISRLTISGGHPLETENYNTCAEIVRAVKQRFKNKNIWVYTGYKWEDIADKKIMNNIDVIVDGRYIEEEKDISLPFRGSRNQRIIDVKKSLEQGKAVIKEVIK